MSKSHPLGDSQTGPNAAAIYKAKHPRGGLRQVSRYLRIQAGLRPLQFDVPTKRERKWVERHAGQSLEIIIK